MTSIVQWPSKELAQEYAEKFIPSIAAPEIVKSPQGYAIKMFLKTTDKQKRFFGQKNRSNES